MCANHAKCATQGMNYVTKNVSGTLNSNEL